MKTADNKNLVEDILLDDAQRPADSPLQHEPGLFRDEAEYDRVVESVVARVRTGEIQPRQPEEED